MVTGWAVKDVTERVYEALEPVARADPNVGWDLLAFVNGLCEMLQDGADLVQDSPAGDPGWSIVLDIDRIPDAGLPWLGQFLGSRFYVGLDAPTMRQQIRDRVTWQRGTPAAIAAAFRLFLSGTKTVQIQERNPTPYSFQVIIWASEAPSDTSATSPLVRYVNQYAKPAGLNWTITVNPGSPPGTTYSGIYVRGDTYNYDYTTFQTYGDIR